jgi:hypothetical protein
MDRLTGFQAGVNLGGWLSQYRKYDHDHFNSFIREADIQQIASWGLDHVRLPVDYPVLEEDDAPGVYKESGFAYIDRCLDWCQDAGLDVVLDLHHAPGYFFGTLDSNTLFKNPEMQERLLQLWRAIVRRYSSRPGPRIIFEFLNEVVLPDSAPWNALVPRLIEAVREIDTEHWLMVGGNYWNAVTALKDLEHFDDPRLVYTFHFYEPLVFTHQKAPWIPEIRKFNTALEFPGGTPGLKEFLANEPDGRHAISRFVDVQMDKDYLRTLLQPAVDFLKSTDYALYCGEFGVIDRAPMASNIRWHRAFIELLNEFSIGRAHWTYKQLDFGLVDRNGVVVNEELVKVVAML